MLLAYVTYWLSSWTLLLIFFVFLLPNGSTILGGGAIAGTVFAARAAGEQQLFL